MCVWEEERRRFFFNLSLKPRNESKTILWYCVVSLLVLLRKDRIWDRDKKNIGRILLCIFERRNVCVRGGKEKVSKKQFKFRLETSYLATKSQWWRLYATSLLQRTQRLLLINTYNTHHQSSQWHIINDHICIVLNMTLLQWTNVHQTCVTSQPPPPHNKHQQHIHQKHITNMPILLSS